jgi:hypothetical protein
MLQVSLPLPGLQLALVFVHQPKDECGLQLQPVEVDPSLDLVHIVKCGAWNSMHQQNCLHVLLDVFQDLVPAAEGGL